MGELRFFGGRCGVAGGLRGLGRAGCGGHVGGAGSGTRRGCTLFGWFQGLSLPGAWSRAQDGATEKNAPKKSTVELPLGPTCRDQAAALKNIFLDRGPSQRIRNPAALGAGPSAVQRPTATQQPAGAAQGRAPLQCCCHLGSRRPGRKGLSASSGGRHAWHASEFLKQRAALSSSSFLLLKSFPICLQSTRAFSEHRPRLALDQPPSVASLSGPARDPELRLTRCSNPSLPLINLDPRVLQLSVAAAAR